TVGRPSFQKVAAMTTVRSSMKPIRNARPIRTARLPKIRRMSGLFAFDGGGEQVAAATYRLDHCRRLGVVTQLATQPAELNVDGPVERSRAAATRPIQKLLAIEHPLWMLEQCHQQVEFAPGQVDQIALGVVERARVGIQPPPGERIHVGSRIRYPVGITRSPQDGADARQQFARIERFWKVIVCAYLQPNDAVEV